MMRRRQNRRHSDDDGSGSTSIPKMELLQMNYVNKMLLPPPPPPSASQQQRQKTEEAKIRSIIAFKKQVSAGQATKSLTRNQNGSAQHSPKHPLKYVVYKKHNSHIDKLQYINDNNHDDSVGQSTLTKTKNIIFGPSPKIKFENIQFYFDSKGYAQHVDKIYGTQTTSTPTASVATATTTTDEISKSNSWSFRKMPPPPPPRDTKIVPLKEKFHYRAPVPAEDAIRIRQLFGHDDAATKTVDETAGSLKKVKKLADNFENRCTCAAAVASSQQQVKTKRKSNDRMTNSKREQRIAMTTENISQIFTAPPDKGGRHHPHPIETSGGKTCGWTKCTFDNCPMSSSSSSASSSSTSGDCNKLKCIDDYLPSTKSKCNNDDDAFDEDATTAATNEARNNLRNLAIEPKFAKNNRQNLNDSIKCKQITKIDFNAISEKNSKQMNTLVALMAGTDDRKRNSTNCVKIFISNAETPPSIKSASSDSSSDLGYYEEKIRSDDPAQSSATSSSGVSSLGDGEPSSSASTSGVLLRRRNRPADVPKLSGLFPSKMGCDGAIFWNDCYYYDEHACCRCNETNATSNEKKSGKFICVCDDVVDQVNEYTKLNKRLEKRRTQITQITQLELVT